MTKLNVQAEETKTYHHPVEITPSAHDEAEAPNSALCTMPETSPGAPRHAECVDCHNSDTGSNLGSGMGPFGPHGSNIPHLLERQDALERPPALPGGASAGVPFSASSYALCDKCHDVQNSIMRDLSFKKHAEHIQQGAACSTCHDPHASSSPMLINFDRSIVGPASNGVLQYTRTGVGHGTCTLTCHGQEHQGLAY